jgi:hypothetical protein
MKITEDDLNALFGSTYFKQIGGYEIVVTVQNSSAYAAYEVKYYFKSLIKPPLVQTSLIDYNFILKCSMGDLLYWQCDLEEHIKKQFPDWVKAQEFNKDMKEILE